MNHSRESDEVLYSAERIPGLDLIGLENLKRLARANERQRIRLCMHSSPDAALHEMFIVHTDRAYVRPHLHQAKDESLHVIDGEADIVLFDEEGRISSFQRLGGLGTSRAFYRRVPCGVLHMLIIRSAVFTFHECTTGPFVRGETRFPEWAPREGSGCEWAFVASIGERIRKEQENRR